MFSRYICFPGVDNGSTLISLCDICRTLNFGRRWCHLYYYRIVYVIINRHDCWTIMVVIRPMDSETWSICIYIGLRTNDAIMAIVVCSYEYILWQICMSGTIILSILLMMSCWYPCSHVSVLNKWFAQYHE